MSFLISKGQETFFYPTTCQPSNHSCKANKVNSVKGAVEVIFSLSKAVVSVPQCCNHTNCLPSIQTRHRPAPTLERSSVLGRLVCLLEKGQENCFRPSQTTENQGNNLISTRSFLKWKKRCFFLHPEETECLTFSEELG